MSNPLEPRLLLSPRRRAVIGGHPTVVEVLIQVQAPAADRATYRPKLNLAFVLDRSGSMAGRPLVEAIRSVRAMLARMTPADRAALVVYDQEVRVLVASSPVVDLGLFDTALGRIEAGGMTDLFGGWQAGAQAILPHHGPEMLSRIVLLSDGKANQGVMEPEAIAASVADQAGAGITTSTYGLGYGFQEDLMIDIARRGAGNCYYGESADDLLEPFETEFDLMTSVVARHVGLSLTPADGVAVTVLNRLPAGRDGAAVDLGDLARGGALWALARVTLPARTGDGDAADVPALAVGAAYHDLAGVRRHVDPVELRLPVVPAAAFAAIAPDPLVESRIAEVTAADIQDRARQAAAAGDWAEVERQLGLARQEAGANPWVAGVLATLEGLAAKRDAIRFTKEAAFSSHRMMKRMTPADEQASRDLGAELDIPSYLRRKTEQGRSPRGRQD